LKGWIFGIATFGIAIVFSALSLVAPGLPAAVLIGLPVIFSLVFAIVAMTALAPKQPAAPAMAKGDAVRLIKFSGSTSTLHCMNPQWADEFARMNGVQAQPKSRMSMFAGGALLSALLGAPIAAGVLFYVAHPTVYVDNAEKDALQIYVDGKPKEVVPADGHINFMIARGKHTFGYSKVGASAPEGTVDGNATMMDGHLYNPAKTACYWLVADSYGDASVMGVNRGPQAIQEFYTFDKVDTWFAENPQTIEVSSGERGGTRVALQRANDCMELVKHGCDAAARETFIDCQKAAKDDASYKKCVEEVSCGDIKPGGHPAVAGAGTAHPSGHTAPPPHAGGHTAPPHPSAVPAKAK
jgi:hypothetical protein